MKWLACLFPALLFCSVNEPMRWEWQTGYRNDNLHWHLQNGISYNERYRDMQFWENALQLSVIYRDLSLFVRGAYGAFGQGTLKQKFSQLSYTSAEPLFHFDTEAWTLDSWGYFGYAVNLTTDRTYKVILVPFVGYGVNFERLNRKGSHETSGEANPPATNFTLFSSLPKNMHTILFGPLVGGFFRIQPGGRIRFEAGYAYHREHIRLMAHTKTQTLIYDGGALTSSSLLSQKIKANDGGNLAHSGWARMDVDLSREWRIGLFAQIQYFVTRVLNVNVKNEETSFVAQQKMKFRWTAVSGALTISRSF